jgi:hypothetical protein
MKKNAKEKKMAGAKTVLDPWEFNESRKQSETTNLLRNCETTTHS